MISTPWTRPGADDHEGDGSLDAMGTDIGSPSLADYGARLRRRWWVVAFAVLVGLGAGLAYNLAQAPEYVSRTSLLVLAPPDVDGSGQGQSSRSLNLDTEAQIVKSASVAEAVQESVGTTRSTAELIEAVSVTVPPNSQVLTIAFDAQTPESAQTGARAFAESYLAQRSSEADARIATRVDALTDELDPLVMELNTTADASAVLGPNTPGGVLAGSRRSILVDQISSLTSRLSLLRATTVTPGRVITEAAAPTSPTTPVLTLDLAAGALVGLLIGLLAAAVADYADHRVRRPGDVSRHANLPVLAHLGDGRDSHDLAAPAAFDLVRNNAVGSGVSTQVVQVQDVGTPAVADECALELARSLARSRSTALLVVGHPRSGLPEVLGAAGARGLADVLRREALLSDVLVDDPGTGVRVLLPGRDPETLPTLLQSPRLPDLVAELRASAQCVVFETEAADRSAAAQVVAGRSDTVLMAAEAGVTDGTRLSESARTVSQAGTSVAGVVLVQRSGRARAAAAGAASQHAPGRPASNSAPR